MKYTKGILLVLSTSLISGFAIFMNKWGIEGVSTYFFTFAKNFIVAILLSAVLIFMYRARFFQKLSSRDWLMLVLIGLIGGSIPFLLFFKGLAITSAAKASFFHKTLFIWLVPISWLFLKKKVNKYELLAACVMLSGSIVYFQYKPEPLNHGDLLILLATLMWALEIALAKKLLFRLSGFLVAWGRMFFGAIFILLFVWLKAGQVILPAHYSAEQYIWIILSAFILFGYVATFYNGLKYIPAFTATAILTLGAPLTALLSLVFEGTHVLPLRMIGIIMLLLGVYLAVFQKKLWSPNASFTK